MGSDDLGEVVVEGCGEWLEAGFCEVAGAEFVFEGEEVRAVGGGCGEAGVVEREERGRRRKGPSGSGAAATPVPMATRLASMVAMLAWSRMPGRVVRAFARL